MAELPVPLDVIAEILIRTNDLSTILACCKAHGYFAKAVRRIPRSFWNAVPVRTAQDLTCILKYGQPTQIVFDNRIIQDSNIVAQLLSFSNSVRVVTLIFVNKNPLLSYTESTTEFVKQVSRYPLLSYGMSTTEFIKEVSHYHDDLDSLCDFGVVNKLEPHVEWTWTSFGREREYTHTRAIKVWGHTTRTRRTGRFKAGQR